VAASSHSSGRSDAITGDDGGESSASSETDADADFRSDTKVTGKNRERVLTAHENYRKGKASKRNEFGKLVKIQEAENQIVTHFEVHADRPADSTLLLSSLQVSQQRLGRIPRMVAADAGFYSRGNEKAGQALGVRCLSVPHKKTTTGGNVFSTSVGFIDGKGGGPGRRGESACSSEDLGYVVASIPVRTVCDDGWGWA
jgi:hypothetical protein